MEHQASCSKCYSKVINSNHDFPSTREANKLNKGIRVGLQAYRHTCRQLKMESQSLGPVRFDIMLLNLGKVGGTATMYNM